MLTILPSFNPAMSDVKQLFVRAFFDYDPATDDMCPSKEFGLPFKFGEILQVCVQCTVCTLRHTVGTIHPKCVLYIQCVLYNIQIVFV